MRVCEGGVSVMVMVMDGIDDGMDNRMIEQDKGGAGFAMKHSVSKLTLSSYTHHTHSPAGRTHSYPLY